MAGTVGVAPPADPTRGITRHGALKFQPEQSDWSIDKLPDLETAYQTRYGRPLPVKNRGQGAIHNQWGLDHRDSADVSLNPTTPEGKQFMGLLEERNTPYLAFDRAIPGVATGPHIHVGRPSHRGGGATAEKTSMAPVHDDLAAGTVVDTQDPVARVQPVAPPATSNEEKRVNEYYRLWHSSPEGIAAAASGAEIERLKEKDEDSARRVPHKYYDGKGGLLPGRSVANAIAAEPSTRSISQNTNRSPTEDDLAAGTVTDQDPKIVSEATPPSTSPIQPAPVPDISAGMSYHKNIDSLDTSATRPRTAPLDPIYAPQSRPRTVAEPGAESTLHEAGQVVPPVPANESPAYWQARAADKSLPALTVAETAALSPTAREALATAATGQFVDTKRQQVDRAFAASRPEALAAQEKAAQQQAARARKLAAQRVHNDQLLHQARQVMKQSGVANANKASTAEVVKWVREERKKQSAGVVDPATGTIDFGKAVRVDTATGEPLHQGLGAGDLRRREGSDLRASGMVMGDVRRDEALHDPVPTQRNNAEKIRTFTASRGRLPTPVEMQQLGMVNPLPTPSPTEAETSIANHLAGRNPVTVAMAQGWPDFLGYVQDMGAKTLRMVEKSARAMGGAHGFANVTPPEPGLVTDVADYLSHRAEINKAIAGYRPQNTTLPEDITTALVRTGFRVSRLLATIELTGASLPTVMVGESFIQNSDKDLKTQAREAAKAYALGWAITKLPVFAQKGLGKVPGAIGEAVTAHPTATAMGIGGAGFGTMGGVEAASRGAGRNEIIAETAAGALTGAVLSGGGPGELARRLKSVPDAVIASERSPEWLREAAGKATGKKPVIIQTEAPEGEVPRSASVYVDPDKPGQFVSREISIEEASKLLTKDRPAKIVTPAQFEQVHPSEAVPEPATPQPIKRQLEAKIETSPPKSAAGVGVEKAAQPAQAETTAPVPDRESNAPGTERRKGAERKAESDVTSARKMIEDLGGEIQTKPGGMYVIRWPDGKSDVAGNDRLLIKRARDKVSQSLDIPGQGAKDVSNEGDNSIVKTTDETSPAKAKTKPDETQVTKPVAGVRGEDESSATRLKSPAVKAVSVSSVPAVEKKTLGEAGKPLSTETSRSPLNAQQTFYSATGDGGLRPTRRGVLYVADVPSVADTFAEGGEFGRKGAKVGQYEGNLNVYDGADESILGKQNLKYIEDGHINFDAFEREPDIKERLKAAGYDAIRIAEGNGKTSIAVLPESASKLTAKAEQSTPLKEGTGNAALGGADSVTKSDSVSPTTPTQGEMHPFPAKMKSLGVPRATMPQVDLEHRGAMTQYLKGRGLDWDSEEAKPRDLKPAQSEYNPAKVEQSRQFSVDNPDKAPRKILVSSDGYVMDGHHQWMAKLEDAPNVPIPILRLHAPANVAIPELREFGSSYTDSTHHKVEPEPVRVAPASTYQRTTPAPGTPERAALPDVPAQMSESEYAATLGQEKLSGRQRSQHISEIKQAIWNGDPYSKETAQSYGLNESLTKARSLTSASDLRAPAAVRREGRAYIAPDGSRFEGPGGKAQAERYTHQLSLVGAQVRSYGGGIDTVVEVNWPDGKGQGTPVYTVKDQEGRDRKHSTPIDSRKVIKSAEKSAKPALPKVNEPQQARSPVLGGGLGGFNPGVNEFISEDVKPYAVRVAAFGKALVGVFRTLSSALKLNTATPVQNRMGDDVYAAVIRAIHTGERATTEFGSRESEVFDANMNQLKKQFNRLPGREMEDFNLLRGTPETQEGQALQEDARARMEKSRNWESIPQLMAAVKDASDSIWQYATDNGLDMNYFEDYFYGSYKDSKKVDQFLDYWRSTEGFLKNKTIPTIADAAGFGLELKEQNPIANLANEMLAVGRRVGLVRLRDQLVAGNGQFFIETKEMSADDRRALLMHGWAPIEDPVFKGMLLDPDYARFVNTLLETNKLIRNPLLRGLQQVNRTARQIKFIGSVFHMVNMFKASVADEALSVADPRGYLDFAKSFAPMDRTDPEYLDYVNLGGGQAYSIEADAAAQLQRGLERLGRGNLLGGVPRIAAAIAKSPFIPGGPGFTNWMFGEYIPALKFAKFSDEVASRQTKLGRLLTDEEKIEIIKRNQNFYGEMNERLFGRGATTTQTLRLVFLAPGYGEGNFRVMGRAAKGDWSSLHFLLSTLLVSAVVAALGTRILSSKWKDAPKSREDVRDMFKIDTGTPGVSVDAMTYDRDYWMFAGNLVNWTPGKITSDLRQRVGGAESPAMGALTDLASWLRTGRVLNWRGQAIIEPNQTWTERAKGIGTEVKELVQPIPVSAYQQSRAKGFGAPASAALAVLGIRPSGGGGVKAVKNKAVTKALDRLDFKTAEIYGHTTKDEVLDALIEKGINEGLETMQPPGAPLGDAAQALQLKNDIATLRNHVRSEVKAAEPARWKAYVENDMSAREKAYREETGEAPPKKERGRSGGPSGPAGPKGPSAP